MGKVSQGAMSTTWREETQSAASNGEDCNRRSVHSRALRGRLRSGFGRSPTCPPNRPIVELTQSGAPKACDAGGPRELNYCRADAMVRALPERCLPTHPRSYSWQTRRDSKSSQIAQQLFKSRASTQIRPIMAKFGPSSTVSGRYGPNIGPCLAQHARCWTKFGQSGPRLGQNLSNTTCPTLWNNFAAGAVAAELVNGNFHVKCILHAETLHKPVCGVTMHKYTIANSNTHIHDRPWARRELVHQRNEGASAGGGGSTGPGRLCWHPLARRGAFDRKRMKPQRSNLRVPPPELLYSSQRQRTSRRNLSVAALVARHKKHVEKSTSLGARACPARPPSTSMQPGGGDCTAERCGARRLRGRRRSSGTDHEGWPHTLTNKPGARCETEQLCTKHTPPFFGA